MVKTIRLNWIETTMHTSQSLGEHEAVDLETAFGKNEQIQLVEPSHT